MGQNGGGTVTDTYGRNIERLRRLAGENGLVLNPDRARVEKVAGLMADNHDLVGEWVCPCKQENRPAVRGVDKTCPCPEWLDEVRLDGCCGCRLFYSPGEVGSAAGGSGSA